MAVVKIGSEETSGRRSWVPQQGTDQFKNWLTPQFSPTAKMQTNDSGPPIKVDSFDTIGVETINLFLLKNVNYKGFLPFGKLS